MFNEYKELRQDKQRKKELKAQLPILLRDYPAARKGRELTVSEKRAKMVLIGHITSLISPYSAEFITAGLYDMADYDFELAPSYEKACQDLGVTPQSINLGTAMNFANNNPIARSVPDFVLEYAKVSNA